MLADYRLQIMYVAYNIFLTEYSLQQSLLRWKFNGQPMTRTEIVIPTPQEPLKDREVTSLTMEKSRNNFPLL